MKINPSAFPSVRDGTEINWELGMTLRDYAAIAMMQTISRIPRDHTTMLEDVEVAFQYADMFLKVREK